MLQASPKSKERQAHAGRDKMQFYLGKMQLKISKKNLARILRKLVKAKLDW